MGCFPYDGREFPFLPAADGLAGKLSRRILPGGAKELPSRTRFNRGVTVILALSLDHKGEGAGQPAGHVSMFRAGWPLFRPQRPKPNQGFSQ